MPPTHRSWVVGEVDLLAAVGGLARWSTGDDASMAALVNVDSFVRAETDRMFAALAAQGGMNRLVHHREPASIAEQPVIRQNRDTLYSSASWTSRGRDAVAPRRGRPLPLGDGGQQRPLHQRGAPPSRRPRVTVDRFDTDYVLVAARILVDPDDAADLEAVHHLQDHLTFRAGPARPFVLPDYDAASFDATRDAAADPGRRGPGLFAPSAAGGGRPGRT